MNQNYKAYRNRIYKLHNIDINQYKQSLDSGKSKNFNIKDITNYDIQQICNGIKIQMQHTDNPYIALQIALDHLAQFNNYYTYLIKMQKYLQNKSNIKQQKINQNKANQLYTDTLIFLRKRFKTMNDAQLQQFMKQLKQFCKDY